MHIILYSNLVVISEISFYMAYFNWQGYTKMATLNVSHSSDHDAPKADKGRCKQFFLNNWVLDTWSFPIS